jgi:CheY-like chemotaxis protein
MRFMAEQNRIFGQRILLVEDDRGARESIKLLLTIDRHQVVEATEGVEAIELVKSQPFDLVILDYFMPGMRGSQLALRIRDIAPSLPILMITAYLEKLGDADKPVDAVIGKPFAVAELRRTIAKLLSWPANDREPSLRSFGGVECLRPLFLNLAPFALQPLVNPALPELVSQNQPNQDNDKNKRNRNHHPQSWIAKTFVEKPAHVVPIHTPSWRQWRASIDQPTLAKPGNDLALVFEQREIAFASHKGKHSWTATSLFTAGIRFLVFMRGIVQERVGQIPGNPKTFVRANGGWVSNLGKAGGLEWQMAQSHQALERRPDVKSRAQSVRNASVPFPPTPAPLPLN